MKFTRDDILEKTVEFAQVHGWAKTSVREISKEIGYSTIKIYSEFGNKDKLLQEIQKKGFRLLRDEYIQASVSSINVEEQLIAICIAHYQFALQHTRYYELMFTNNSALCKSASSNEIRQAAEPVRQIIEKITGQDNMTHFMHWFSLVHGYYEVTSKDSSRKYDELKKVLAQIAVNFIKGIK